MFYTKLALLSTILATWAAAHYDKSLPYFPIEISRTATGSLSRQVFSYGVTVCTLLMWLESSSRTDYVAWAGLLLLAWVDDVTSLKWHQVGVGIMAGGVFLKAMQDPFHSGLLFLAAATIYALRLLIKVGVLVVLEFRRPLDVDTLVGIIYNVDGFRQKLIRRAYAIMYRGESKAERPGTSIALFSLCGVLQWLVFFIFSTLY